MTRLDRSFSGWHAEDVKAAIRKKGETLSSLAEREGFDGSYLRHTLRRSLPTGEAIIARFLGISAKSIWPDRYDANGVPRTARSRRARP